MGTMSGGNGNSGAGGYNPQIMPGQNTINGGSLQNGAGGGPGNIDGTPFWQPWSGWNMKMGMHDTAAGNDAQAAAMVPGATPGLNSQMANLVNLPLYTNPNQYGRYNWGTNMQGGGIPSPFGQYAQQFAQYKPLNFPPPPQAGGGGPGPGPGPSGPPSGPPGLGGGNIPPGQSWMQGASSALGRPDLNTGRVDPSAFAGNTAGLNRAQNIYGGQVSPSQMTPQEAQMSQQYTKDTESGLNDAFARMGLNVAIPQRNHKKSYSGG